MQKLPHAVLSYVHKQELLKPGDRVGIAVSGGADSVALLRMLLELRHELGLVLSVVHMNHQIRGAESDADEQFVSSLAARHELESYCETRDVPAHAVAHRLSLETAAREVRYEYFDSLLICGKLNRIATAHTLDDQAETVLMRVVRGTGLSGLGGIQPKLKVTKSENEGNRVCGTIVRPLLATRHKELESYLNALGQNWRQDSTNMDVQHTRNRIRNVLVPLIEREFNPSVAERLDELSEIARAEEEFWDRECSGVIEKLLQRTRGPRCTLLDMKLFNAQPVPIQRRVLRHWGRKTQPSVALEFKHIEQIRELVSEKSNESREGRQVELPGRWRAIRKGHYLELATSDLSPSDRSDVLGEYQYAFTVPGTITVRELGIALEAISIPPNPSTHGYNPDQLLDPSFLGQELTVRSWRPGDRFWPAHTKAPKKIKELLQEKHLDVNERKLWPVLVSRRKIVWVLGFAVPVEFQARQGEEALLIRTIEGINEASYRQSTVWF